MKLFLIAALTLSFNALAVEVADDCEAQFKQKGCIDCFNACKAKAIKHDESRKDPASTNDDNRKQRRRNGNARQNSV